MFRRGRLIGFLLTAVFLWFVVRNVSLEELAAAFRAADYRLVAPAAAATLCGYLLRTARWQRIVQPVAPMSFGSSFSILMMGFAANNLLPARLGELVRAYLLGRKTGVRKTYGMATIILERVCDGLTLIALLGVVSLLMPLPLWGQEVQLLSSVVFTGAAVGVVLLLLQEQLAVRLLGLVLTPFPTRVSGALLRATTAFISGLHSLRSGRTIAVVALFSAAVWLLEATSYLLLTRAFGIWMSPLHQALVATFLLVTVNLGIMLPSAPGYIGSFHFFAVAALVVFGVSKETALAIAISSHGVQYLLVTGIGVVLLARENVALSSLGAKATEGVEDEEAAAPAASK